MAAAAKVAAQAPSANVPEAPAAPGYSDAISEAVGHYAARRWREAHAAFARAHALQPSARTHRGLGLAAFYLDEFAEARQAFEQALSDTRRPLPEEQRLEIAELLAVCARETGRVQLRITPASARVELDGEPTERRVLLLERGQHVLALSAEGYVAERTRLVIAGGEERVFEHAMVALERHPVPSPATIVAPVSSTEAAAPPTDSPAAEPRRARVFTWIAAAAVPVFAGTAAAVWFTGKAERDEIEQDCARDHCDGAEIERRFEDAGIDAHETWATVSLAASGVALAAAAVLFVVEGDSGGNFSFDATHRGAALHGRF